MATAITNPTPGSSPLQLPAIPPVSDSGSGGPNNYRPAAVLPTSPSLPTPGPSAPGPSGTIGAPASPGIGTIRTYAELQQAAQDQVNQEIAGQEAPLKGQLGILGSQETNAQGALTSMYSSLMPYVSGEAAMVSNDAQQAELAQQQIFSTANAQMNQLLQQRAQQAQALAQEIGGPVAISDFNGNLGSYAGALAQTGAADQLHALTMGEAGVNEAADFAGQVFPMTQVEHQSEIESNFDQKKQAIQDQINTLEGTKAGAVNSKLNDMLAAERTYALNEQQNKEQVRKDNLDAAVQNHTLKNDDRRLTLAEREFAQSKTAQNTQLAQRATEISNQAIEAAAKIGVSKETLQARINAQTTSSAIAEQRVKVQEQKNAIALTTAVGKPGKPITLTRRFVLDPVAAQIAIAKGSTSIYRDPKTGQYFTTKQVTKTAQQWENQNGIDTGSSSAVGNLTSLYQTMIQNGISKPVALGAIRKRFNKPGWTP